MKPQQKSQQVAQQKSQKAWRKLDWKVTWTIKNRLIISFLVVLLLPTAALGYFSYQRAKTDITGQILSNTEQTVASVNSQINSLFETSIDDLNYLSKTVNASMVNGLESPELRRILDPVKAVKDEYDYVQYATTGGKLLNSPQQTFKKGFDPRERDWYKNAINQKGQALVNQPIIGQDGSIMMIPSKATEDGSGVVSVSISLTNLAQEVNETKIGEKGYVAILDKELKYLSHPTVDSGTEAEQSFITDLQKHNGSSFNYMSGGTEYKAVVSTNTLTGWTVVGVMDMKEITSASRGILKTTIAIIVVAILIGALLVLAIIRSIHRPLSRLMEATERIAAGDLQEEIKVTSRDELGALSGSVNKMTLNLRHLIGQLGDNTEQVAATSVELSASAEQTRNTAEHISGAVQEIAAGAEKQVNAAEEFTQTISEISTGMERAAESIQFVSELTAVANEKADNGNAVVGQTVGQMTLIQQTFNHTAEVVNHLDDKTNAIGNIVGLIANIAGQTNLLALNAAIEAARAGEEGKGFSVVASEVRKLAEQSAAAAGQIGEIIRQLQTEAGNAVQAMTQGTLVVQEGINLVHLTGDTFKEIVDSVIRAADEALQVSSIVKQVNANAQNMVESAAEVAGIAGQSAGNTQNVAAAAEQQSASMQEVSAAAESLSKMAQQVQDLIGQFKL